MSMTWRKRDRPPARMLEWTRDCQPASMAWLKRTPLGASVVPEERTIRQPAEPPAVRTPRSTGAALASSHDDYVARQNARGLERRHRPPYRVVEVAIGELAPALDERGRIGRLRRPAADPVGDVHPGWECGHVRGTGAMVPQ